MSDPLLTLRVPGGARLRPCPSLRRARGACPLLAVAVGWRGCAQRTCGCPSGLAVVRVGWLHAIAPTCPSDALPHSRVRVPCAWGSPRRSLCWLPSARHSLGRRVPPSLPLEPPSPRGALPRGAKRQGPRVPPPCAAHAAAHGRAVGYPRAVRCSALRLALGAASPCADHDRAPKRTTLGAPCGCGSGSPYGPDVFEGCYLVDPASSHMLVSKIKPCMCKYELIPTVKLRMAH